MAAQVCEQDDRVRTDCGPDARRLPRPESAVDWPRQKAAEPLVLCPVRFEHRHGCPPAVRD